MFAGSWGRNLKAGTTAKNQYHFKCPASAAQIQHQRLASMYDLGSLRKDGLQIIDVDEFWKLRRCGLIPKESTYLEGSLAKGTPDNPDAKSCFMCDDDGEGGLKTTFHFTNSERFGARNQAICGMGAHISTWHKAALSDAPVIETCCIRKEAMKKLKAPPGTPAAAPVRLVFSEPRFYADRFLEKHGIANGAGYIGVQFRAEKLTREFKHWERYKNYTRDLVADSVKKHTLADGTRPKVYLACDFSEGGSSSFRPNGRAKSTMMQIFHQITDHYDTVFFSPKADLPEALEANNHMLIAGTELLILARGKDFIPLVTSGRYQSMVMREHKTHSLDGAQPPADG